MNHPKFVRRLSATDLVFLMGESPTVMNHVGALLPLSAPEDAAAGWLDSLMEELRVDQPVQAPWNQRLAFPGFLKNPAQSWVETDDIDIAHHVRRRKLTSSGGEQDARLLNQLVSRLHAQPLDLTRPAWEVTLIEGIDGANLAIYAKMHHSLIDGFTGIKLLRNSLSNDPTRLDMPLFPFREPPASKNTNQRRRAMDFRALARREIAALPGAVRATSGVWRSIIGQRGDLLAPLRAPHSILNQRIDHSRSFEHLQVNLALIRKLAGLAGGTINDIVLALSAGALRRFLREMGELPDEALVAMLPVNIRPEDDPGGGNAVAALLAPLATNIADSMERLETIIRATDEAKNNLRGLSQAELVQHTAMLLLPTGVQHFGGLGGRIHPQFNVIISNVPGPENPLYFRGARLDAIYPMSFPIHGQALNISCQSYAGTLNFGLTACRNIFPHLDHLAAYLSAELDHLAHRLTA